VYILYSNWQLV